MNKKYKIAVMGESNVDKTVFFGSYFHQATDLGKAKYTVAIKSQDSDDKITEIITQLFEKRQVIERTDVRVDFSFSVDALGMDIELLYLPGGFTTNRNYWDDESVRKDLQDADGALFFISSYEALRNYAEAKGRVTEESSRLQQEIRNVLDNSSLISLVTSKVNDIPNIARKNFDARPDFLTLGENLTENFTELGENLRWPGRNEGYIFLTMIWRRSHELRSRKKYHERKHIDARYEGTKDFI